MDIAIKDVKLMFDYVAITSDIYTEDETINGIITKSKGNTKEYQTVVYAGPMAKDIKVGDVVVPDFRRYAIMQHEQGSLKNGIIDDNAILGYNLDWIEVNGEKLILIKSQDIKYVISSYDKLESKVIKPQSKKIIV